MKKIDVYKVKSKRGILFEKATGMSYPNREQTIHSF